MNIAHVNVDNLYHMSSMIGIERIGFPTLPPPLEYDTMGVCFFKNQFAFSMQSLHSQNLKKLNAIDIKH